MPDVTQSQRGKTETVSDLLHFVFESCLDGMLQTQTYSKYGKIPGMITMFKRGALADIKKIESTPSDVDKVDLLMKKVYLHLQMYYDREMNF